MSKSEAATTANPKILHTFKLTGTSPLSFEVKVGATLSVRRYSASNNIRPSVGAVFKTSAYIVYKGITKVGQINKKDLPLLGDKVPSSCVVVAVDAAKNLVSVAMPVRL